MVESPHALSTGYPALETDFRSAPGNLRVDFDFASNLDCGGVSALTTWQPDLVFTGASGLSREAFHPAEIPYNDKRSR